MKGTRLKRGKRQRRPFERANLAAGTVLFPSVPRGGLPFPLGPRRGGCAREAALRSRPSTERNEASGQRRRSNRALFYEGQYISTAPCRRGGPNSPRNAPNPKGYGNRRPNKHLE